MAHSKRYNNNFEKINREKEYSLEEAAELLTSFSPPKFDESIEVAINLGIQDMVSLVPVSAMLQRQCVTGTMIASTTALLTAPLYVEASDFWLAWIWGLPFYKWRVQIQGYV